MGPERRKGDHSTDKGVLDSFLEKREKVFFRAASHCCDLGRSPLLRVGSFLPPIYCQCRENKIPKQSKTLEVQDNERAFFQDRVFSSQNREKFVG